MRIKDEAMFMSKSGGASPVMDGLVSWIDGRYYDLATNSYKDLCTSNQIQVTREGGVNAEVINNCVKYNRNGSWWSEVATDTIVFQDPVFAIEAVVSCDEVPPGGENDYTVTVGVRNTVYNFVDLVGVGTTNRYGGTMRVGAYQHFVPAVRDTQYHIMMVVSPDGKNYVIYVNGNNVASTEVDWNRSQRTKILPFFISHGQPNRDVSGRHGCTRLYNRTLTEEEVLQNYNYEKSLGRVE